MGTWAETAGPNSPVLGPLAGRNHNFYPAFGHSYAVKNKGRALATSPGLVLGRTTIKKSFPQSFTEYGGRS